MYKYLILFLFVFVNVSFSVEYYINGAIGSDTTVANDGSTPTKAFKTINKAIKLVGQSDVIIIEGMNKEDRIIYKENLIVPKEKLFFTIKGNNLPLISPNNKQENAGIIVLNSDIRIEGIEFKDFIDGNVNQFKLGGGAGIIVKNGNRDAAINNCKFTNCNYGIIANENQSLRIDGNTFTKIEKISSKFIDGGVGILIMSDGKYIQDNQIGVKSGNTFSEIDNYGILLGNENKLVLADYSKISNNTFSNMKGVGLGIFNVEGIFNITANTFEKCNTSLELRGESIDAVISDNTFKGASGDYEIISDEKYPGELLHSIWKGNNNTFDKKLNAISDGTDDSIKAINGKRFITTNSTIIKANSNNQEKILE